MRKTAKKILAAGTAVCALMISFPCGASAADNVIVAGQAPGESAKESGVPGLEAEAAAGSGVSAQKAEEPGTGAVPADAKPAGSFDVDRFVLPEGAGLLVVVEGTGGANCSVYAYAREGGQWVEKVNTCGLLGLNGMSNHRTEGDKTTPIGLFQMNTPFGQDDPLEGFPQNYIKVKESHVWSEDTNKLVDDASVTGEHVGTVWYDGYYDYAIDAGYNRQGIAGKGSALFLHCIREGRSDTSGCVAIPKEQMAEVMRLYGTYGDGACYIAQAPRGTFDLIYDSYGVNGGLSPDGEFEK